MKTKKKYRPLPSAYRMQALKDHLDHVFVMGRLNPFDDGDDWDWLFDDDEPTVVLEQADSPLNMVRIGEHLKNAVFNELYDQFDFRLLEYDRFSLRRAARVMGLIS